MIKSVVLSIIASLRGLHLRAANVLQDPFAQQVGVALTGFRKIDDSAGDGLLDEIVEVFGPQGDASISKATPRMRVVSGSSRSPLR